MHTHRCRDCELANEQLLREFEEQISGIQSYQQEKRGQGRAEDESRKDVPGISHNGILATALALIFIVFTSIQIVLWLQDPSSDLIHQQQQQQQQRDATADPARDRLARYRLAPKWLPYDMKAAWAFPDPSDIPIPACITPGRLDRRQGLPIAPAWLPDAMVAAWAIPNRPEVAIAWAASRPLRSAMHLGHPLYEFWHRSRFNEPHRHMWMTVLGSDAVWWMNGSLELQLAALKKHQLLVEEEYTGRPFSYRLCSSIPGLLQWCPRLLPSPTRLLRLSLDFTEHAAHFCADVEHLERQDRFSLRSEILDKTFQLRHEVWSDMEKLLLQDWERNDHDGTPATIYHLLDGLAAVDAEAMLLEWLAVTMLSQYDEVAHACRSVRQSARQANADLNAAFTGSHKPRQSLQLRNRLQTLFGAFSETLPFRLGSQFPSTAPNATFRTFGPGTGSGLFNWRKTSLEQSFKRSSVNAVCDDVIALHADTLSSDERACLARVSNTSSVVQQKLWNYWWNHADPGWTRTADMAEEASQQKYQPLHDAWPRMDETQPCKRRLSGHVGG